MNTAISSLSRLFSSSSRNDAAEPDPGDMGTCFGMEMTLQRDPPMLESEWSKSASTRPAAPPGPARKRGWRPWGTSRPAPEDPLAA